MINTIFYFVDNMSPEQYTEMVEDKLISPRTLVFAKDQKAIYMGGQSYGKMGELDLVLMMRNAILNGDVEIDVYDDTEVQQRIQEIAADLLAIQNKTDEIGMTEEQIQRLLTLESLVNGTNVSTLITNINEKASLSDVVASINDGQSLAHAAVLATANGAFNTNITNYNDRLTLVEQSSSANSAAISTVIDASTNTITAKSMKNALASDTGVWNEMKTAFAMDVNGENIVSSTKESIAQDFSKASWEQYVSYMTGVASDANTAITDTKAYVDGKKALIDQFATFIGNDGVSATSIASKLANSTEAVNTLSTKFDSKGAASTAQTAAESYADSAVASLSSSVYNKGEVDTKLGTKANSSDVYAKADVYTKAEVNTATAGLQASINTLDGNVVKKASVIAAINNSGESNVTINADKINLNGDVIAQRLTAVKATIEDINVHSGGIWLDTQKECAWTHELINGLAAITVGKLNIQLYTKNINGSPSDEITFSNPQNLASVIGGAILDASGLGITLIDPNTTLYTPSENYPLIGFNYIYPNAQLKVIDLHSEWPVINGSALYTNAGFFTGGPLVSSNDAWLGISDGAKVHSSDIELFNGCGISINGKSNNDVILAGGGTKALSDITSGYLPKAGGEMAGAINFSNEIYGINFSNGNPNVYGSISWSDDITALNLHSSDKINLDSSVVWSEGNILAPNFIQDSDETLKDKVSDVELSAEQIAKAPAIKFTWKDEKRGTDVNVGTVAQYWQDILPEVVGESADKKLTLNYPALATVSVISLAKEVVELKNEVSDLKQRLEALGKLVNNG